MKYDLIIDDTTLYNIPSHVASIIATEESENTLAAMRKLAPKWFLGKPSGRPNLKKKKISGIYGSSFYTPA